MSGSPKSSLDPKQKLNECNFHSFFPFQMQDPMNIISGKYVDAAAQRILQSKKATGASSANRKTTIPSPFDFQITGDNR
jgi:hypothetical protein